jgi:predicted ferric reductase
MFRLTALITLLWLPSLLVGYEQFGDFFFWRSQLTMLTGVLGLGYMCVAVLLAARFKWVESVVNGLDKGYAIHKKLGIGALISLISHWAIVKSAHWLIQAELIARPHRGGHPVIEGINWRSIAEQVGDISFKFFIIFSVISLVQAISYKKFKFTHKLGGILVLAGVFHAMFLLDWSAASVAMNLAISLLSLIGVWCSCLSLFGKIGQRNQSEGHVSAIEKFGQLEERGQALSVVRFSVNLDTTITYKEGQFAYLNFHDGEAPHPFSILNYDKQSNQIQFGIKALGDYTSELVNKLDVGQRVTVEGSYGKFQISDVEHQVWIGAGIGIIPFISRLYWLKNQQANQPNKYQKIDLFYCVNSKREAYFEKEMITILNHLSFVQLHLLDADNNQVLDGRQIEQEMSGKTYDVSFCGPESFGKQLQEYLKKAGLPEQSFHTEIFKMR